MFRQGYTYIIFLSFFCFWATQTHAQNYSSSLLSSVDGLSNNEINEIFQDSRGYLWIATEDGLNRYDGYEFEIFRKDIADSLSIGSNMIHCIDEDEDSNLWFGTDRGLSFLDVSTGNFLNISFREEVIGSQRNEAFDLILDNNGYVWCLLQDVIVQYHPRTNTYSEFPLPKDCFLHRNSLEGVIEYHESSGTILIGTGNGLFYMKQNFREVRASGVQASRIYDIFVCEHGKLWVASSEGLIQCGNEKFNGEFNMCRLVLSSQIAKGIAPDMHGNLIVLSDESVVLYNGMTDAVLSKMFFQIPGYDRIPNVRATYVDQTNNLWVGTHKGLCHINLKSKSFQSHHISPSGQESISSSLVSAVASDEHHVYVGYWLGGLEVINKDTKESLYFPMTEYPEDFPRQSVNNIYIDSRARIWVFGENMFRFYPETGTFVSVADELGIREADKIRGHRIYDVLQYEEHYFVMSHMNGIYLLNDSLKTLHEYPTMSLNGKGIPLYGVTSLALDDDFLWISNFSGVMRFCISDSTVLYYPSDAENGLSGRITTMKVDSRGAVWAGSPEGLYRYSESDSVFETFTVRDGLSNDFIYSIEEDSEGMLWISTNMGINRLDPATLEVKSFGIQHGLSAMEFNLNASFYNEASDVMYFGSIDGLNYFCPKKIIHGESSAPVLISKVKVVDEDNVESESFVPEELKITDKESVQLYFSILDYTLSNYNEYKYRLSKGGHPGDWTSISTENRLLLSGLEHGKYSFEVLGANSLGDWSPIPAALSITVKAPIYRRNITIVILFVTVLILLYLFFVSQTKTLRISNRVLREKEFAAKEVLKQKNLLSRRNKNIEDSLKYAQRIQYAMFTSAAEIKRMIPESFVFSKPKDIVSGDFYWATEIDSKIFLAAADCTGHGVPGAFMSLIGIEFFRQIIGVQKIYTPALILDEINRSFDRVFGPEGDIDLRDGMDLAFMVFDAKTNKVEFSGAMNPLYIVRDGEIIEIRADRIILGPDLGFGRPNFTNNEFQLEENDTLYMFSDGYVDQFGGPEGKKFKFRRFRHLLMSIADQPMELQEQVLDSTMKGWSGNFEQVDDVLVMGLRPCKNSLGSSTSPSEDLSSEQGHQPEKVY